MNKLDFKSRADKLKILMEELDIDYCVATPGTNFYYISGIMAFRLERFVAVVIPKKNDPWIICPKLEEENFRIQTFIEDIYSWGESENPFELMAKVMKGTGKDNRIGLEPTTYFNTFLKIKEQFPSWDFKDSGELFVRLRIRKTSEEINAIKKAVYITEKNIDEALHKLHPGITEEQFKEFLTGPDRLVQFGKSSSLPHSEGGKEVLRENDVVLIDKGDRWDNYLSDITRTSYYGKADPLFLKIWDIVREARDEAIDKASPGVPCEVIDKAARDVIKKAGYGEYFIHRTGHGLGLDVHEEPYLAEGNKRLLEPGNVFTIEPGIYLPGKFGVRIEENIVITEEGSTVLSGRPTEPVILK